MAPIYKGPCLCRIGCDTWRIITNPPFGRPLTLLLASSDKQLIPFHNGVFVYLQIDGLTFLPTPLVKTGSSFHDKYFAAKTRRKQNTHSVHGRMAHLRQFGRSTRSVVPQNME